MLSDESCSCTYAIPIGLVEKLQKSDKFNQGYAFTELLAAAELDMQWHILPENAPLHNVDDFEAGALKKTHLDLNEVPPRYRSSYFQHIWLGKYSAGYYAYLRAEMLDDAFQWFIDHGGLTRANDGRFAKWCSPPVAPWTTPSCTAIGVEPILQSDRSSSAAQCYQTIEPELSIG